jgi:branched-chain amino acid transport system substrate-binding protein
MWQTTHFLSFVTSHTTKLALAPTGLLQEEYMTTGSKKTARRLIAIGATLALGLGVSAQITPANAAAAAKMACGLGNGKKATGAPIKIGAVVTSIPGIDFTDGTKTEAAYYKCINDNGGINGRPVQLIVENDKLDPAVAAAAATKLIEKDKVIVVSGSFSIIDCPVNQKYYASKGYNIIVAGVPAECFGSPNIAAANMGPHYSAQGAAQAVVKAGAKGKIVHVTPKAPGAEYNGSSVKTIAENAGMQFEDVLVDAPIKDPAALARSLVDKAGKGGGVVMTATPPNALAIMQGALDQGVIDEVVWGSATPANDLSVAKAAGKEWNNKLLINAELNLLDSNGPDMQLYRKIMAKYDTKTPIGSFGQMGFLIAKMVTDTLIKSKATDSKAANAALKGIKDFKNDIICKPWYFGDLPAHVPNNYDRTVVPVDGGFKLKEDCFAIEATDQVLKDVRAYEKANGIK